MRARTSRVRPDRTRRASPSVRDSRSDVGRSRRAGPRRHDGLRKATRSRARLPKRPRSAASRRGSPVNARESASAAARAPNAWIHCCQEPARGSDASKPAACERESPWQPARDRDHWVLRPHRSGVPGRAEKHRFTHGPGVSSAWRTDLGQPEPDEFEQRVRDRPACTVEPPSPDRLREWQTPGARSPTPESPTRARHRYAGVPAAAARHTSEGRCCRRSCDSGCDLVAPPPLCLERAAQPRPARRAASHAFSERRV